MKRHAYTLKVVLLDLMIIEFGPVGFFIAAYYLSNFSTAALTLAISTAGSLLVSLLINKRVPWFATSTGILTATMAYITYWYDEPHILILTDSFYYFSLTFTFAFSILFNRYILRSLFKHVFSLNDVGWRILEFRGFFLFAMAGVINELVRANLALDHWIIYKQLVIIGMLVFGAFQLRVTCLHRTEQANVLGLCTLIPVCGETKSSKVT